MATINFFNELKNRWAASKPIFFKKIQTFGIALSGLGTALLAIPSVNDEIQKIAGYVLAASAAIAFLAQFAVKDPDYATLDKKPVETPTE